MRLGLFYYIMKKMHYHFPKGCLKPEPGHLFAYSFIEHPLFAVPVRLYSPRSILMNEMIETSVLMVLPLQWTAKQINRHLPSITSSVNRTK